MNNTNNSDNNDNDDNSEIYISNLINDLENLGGEKNKDEFIKNYAKLKEQIKITDNILNLTDNTEPDYITYPIQELFAILESNSQFISNPDKLETSMLRTLLKISKILEEKLNTETINIFESK
jgi:hypothetical protein